MTENTALRAAVDKALAARNPSDAACYLAEMVASEPHDRHTRLALAIALGDAGEPAEALAIIRMLADRLAHEGLLLPAIAVIRHGLQHAPDDPSLHDTLRRIHVRAARAKAGQFAVPPALNRSPAAPVANDTAQTLLALPHKERMQRAVRIGKTFPQAAKAVIPQPLPLFCELETETFIETVKRLRYKRVPPKHRLIVEGEPGTSLFIVVSGKLAIDKGGNTVATVGPGTVIGEMALITGAPRSATATTIEETECFTLERDDVRALAANKAAVAEELLAYCRNRLVEDTLRFSPLFKRFDSATRAALGQRFARINVPQGHSVIEQGHVGTGIYVIASGEAEVSVKNDKDEQVVVASLGPGEVFGEISLIKDNPTVATVRARTALGLLFLPRDDFQKALEQQPQLRDELRSLSADRLKATRAAREADETLSADDLIIL